MKQSQYTWSFSGAVVALTIAALASYREIGALALRARTDAPLRWPSDTVSSQEIAVAPLYAQVAATDERWRRENARQYTLAELRVRGDGRRSPRQVMQDRVYSLTRQGNRARRDRGAGAVGGVASQRHRGGPLARATAQRSGAPVRGGATIPPGVGDRGRAVTMQRLGLVAAALLLNAGAAGAALGQRATTRPSASTRSLQIRAEMAAVLLQSGRYDEAAREYATLLALEPNNHAYRLALVQSLAWGKRLREAERQLRVLSKNRPGDPAVDSMLNAVRSAINPGSGEAATWLAGRPESPRYRLMLARALLREGRVNGALAQYDTVLRAMPTPDLFVERASLHVERRDFVAAERDLNSSIALAPTYEAYLLLGDLHRWRGNLRAARAAYLQARATRADAPALIVAFGRLAREERPPVAYIPDVGEPDGWETTNTTAADDLGMSFTTLSVRRGLRQRRGFDVSGGVKGVRLAERDPVRGGGEEGYGANLAASREGTRRQFHARARVQAGFVYHPSGGLVPESAIALAGFAGAWGLGAEIFTGPAYPALLTLATMQPLEPQGALLRDHSRAFSLAGPVGVVDVAARWQSTSMSDGNIRVGLQGYGRLPSGRPVALVVRGQHALLCADVTAVLEPRALRRARRWTRVRGEQAARTVRCGARAPRVGVGDCA